MMRAIVLVKQLMNELTRAVHGNAYVSVKVAGRVISTRVVFSILTFFFVYILANFCHFCIAYLFIIFVFFIKYRLFPKYFTDKSGNKKTAWSAVFILG